MSLKSYLRSSKGKLTRVPYHYALNKKSKKEGIKRKKETRKKKRTGMFYVLIIKKEDRHVLRSYNYL
jgi:hypothetical protein